MFSNLINSKLDKHSSMKLSKINDLKKSKQRTYSLNYANENKIVICLSFT